MSNVAEILFSKTEFNYKNTFFPSHYQTSLLLLYHKVKNPFLSVCQKYSCDSCDSCSKQKSVLIRVYPCAKKLFVRFEKLLPVGQWVFDESRVQKNKIRVNLCNLWKIKFALYKFSIKNLINSSFTLDISPLS